MEHDQNLIKPAEYDSVMNVSTKFQINALSSLSRNARKPQKCDRLMNQPMNEQTDKPIPIDLT